MEKTALKNGTVLLAQPFMLDSNFRRSAILVCEHNEEGSVGFIMNKPLEMRIDELIGDFPEMNAAVYFGGPVQTDTIHYIHNVGDLLEDSIKVVEGVYWGGDFEKLKFLVKNELVKPENIRFFVGYSGWSEGQLADELVHGSWLTSFMDANFLFRLPSSELWKTILEEKGKSFEVIAQLPEDLSWN